MKIAFTYNLKTTDNLEDAEFDSPETVQFITQTLRELGHHVEPLEVSGPVSGIVARLEALNPELIFNTAEGRFGKLREGFYPAIFEQLNIPYTGSDAYTCGLTLDKYLTKLILEKENVPTPKSLFINNKNIRDIKEKDFKFELKFPVFMKPNFEGSSKGISAANVLQDLPTLIERAQEFLRQFPEGLIVEEFIPGRDVTVPFLEAMGQDRCILTPAEYRFHREERVSDSIYDYELKNHNSERVEVLVPAQIDEAVLKTIRRLSLKVVRTLGIRDVARLDFRVTPDNKVYFIEINALPSLESGASLFESAKHQGLFTEKEVIDRIIKSAVRRNYLKMKLNRVTRRKNKLRVGLTFNEKRISPKDNPLVDMEAEYDSPTTLNAIREALTSYGYEVVDLEATSDLPSKLLMANVDVVFNIAEGLRGRSRESQVPAILELMNIEYTGSDSTALALTLDKALAKKIVQQTGVLTPKFVLFETGKEKMPPMNYPLIIKPVAEGSSKGVVPKSIVHNETELREVARQIIQRYNQAAIAEEFLVGREFTVALIGEKRVKVLPPMEIIFNNKEDKYPIYSFDYKLDYHKDLRYQCPAQIDPRLKARLESEAKKAFTALGCRDFARIDFRLDAQGRVNFIECNPLPGLSPGWSDMCLIAESVGIDYRTLIGEIIAPAVKRFKLSRKSLGLGAGLSPSMAISAEENAYDQVSPERSWNYNWEVQTGEIQCYN